MTTFSLGHRICGMSLITDFGFGKGAELAELATNVTVAKLELSFGPEPLKVAFGGPQSAAESVASVIRAA